jgi:hypothetical protein
MYVVLGCYFAINAQAVDQRSQSHMLYASRVLSQGKWYNTTCIRSYLYDINTCVFFAVQVTKVACGDRFTVWHFCLFWCSASFTYSCSLWRCRLSPRQTTLCLALAAANQIGSARMMRKWSPRPDPSLAPCTVWLTLHQLQHRQSSSVKR